MITRPKHHTNVLLCLLAFLPHLEFLFFCKLNCIYMCIFLTRMQRKSAIGHTGLPFNCPHTEELANEVIGLMELNSHSRVLDLGCGKAELLTRIVEKYECTGTGVDTNPNILSISREPTQGVMKLLEKDMAQFIEENDSEFEAILCIGSIREGEQDVTIKKLSTFLAKSSEEGGSLSPQHSTSYLLLGELVWVRPPTTAFLEHLGIKESDYCTRERLCEICLESGLEVVFSTSQSLETYELSILDNIETWAASPGNATDPDYDVIVGKSRDWHKFSKEHAWNTWEFATILVRRG